MQSKKMSGLLLLVVMALLQACVYVPKTTEVYDADCRMVQKKMFLTQEQLGTFGSCSNEGCLGDLVAAGLVATASLVVSGSIVIVGNTVSWIEKYGRCQQTADHASTH